jgi:hypothetical protein
VLALAIIQRRVLQIKAMEEDDFLPLQGLVVEWVASFTEGPLSLPVD